jgi:hypothetical protein
MIEFLQSPFFLLSAIVATIVTVTAVVLWKNVHWPSRNVTPAEQVAERQLGILEKMKNILSKSAIAWGVFGAVILIALAVWGLSAHGTGWSSLLQPTPELVWWVFKNYWFWIVLILAGLYFWFDGITPATAWSKGVRGMVVAVGVLIAGAMAVHGIWGDSSISPQATLLETPPASAPQSTWPTLVIPAGGRTELLTVKPDTHLVFRGNNFRIHNVYLDGRECITGSGCSDGPLRGAYLTTYDTKMPGVASYSYDPM